MNEPTIVLEENKFFIVDTFDFILRNNKKDIAIYFGVSTKILYIHIIG